MTYPDDGPQSAARNARDKHTCRTILSRLKPLQVHTLRPHPEGSHALACDRLEGWPQAPDSPPSFETHCGRQGATTMLLRMRSQSFARSFIEAESAYSQRAIS